MRFNGQVEDLGSRVGGVVYEKSWLGEDLEKLKEYARGKCVGEEVVSEVCGREGDRWKVTMRVRSDRGIV